MYIRDRHFIIIKVVTGAGDYDDIKVCCNYNV